MRCIVVTPDDKYLTHRRKVKGGRMYERRSGWSDSLQDAKVFATKGAATSAAQACYETREDFEVKEVEIVIKA